MSALVVKKYHIVSVDHIAVGELRCSLTTYEQEAVLFIESSVRIKFPRVHDGSMIIMS